MGKSNPNVIWPHKLALSITFSQDPEFLSGKISPFTLFLVQLKGKALEKGRIKSVEIVFLFIYFTQSFTFVCWIIKVFFTLKRIKWWT